MKILVVGGAGHIGRRIVSSLESNSQFELTVGGRYPHRYTNGVLICVDQPDTFPVVDSFDAVVNCTDTFRIDPVPLFEYCIRHQKLYIETSADTETYIKLFDAFEAVPVDQRLGSAILGLGIFPGLSNIIAGDAIRALENCQSINVHLSWSVISGAGAGTCEVMVQSLVRPIKHVRNGQIVKAAPVGRPQPVNVFDGLKSGFELGLPESYLLFKSHRVPNTSVIVSTRPAGPVFLIRCVHWMTRIGFFRPKAIQFVLRFLFRFVRVRLLSNRSTSLQMAAFASSDIDGKTAMRRIECQDAFQAAADVLLCCLSLYNKKPKPAPGVYTADQLFTLDQFHMELESQSITNICCTESAKVHQPAATASPVHN